MLIYRSQVCYRRVGAPKALQRTAAPLGSRMVRKHLLATVGADRAFPAGVVELGRIWLHHVLTISTEEFDAPRLLAHWEWRIPQHLQPLFLSAFGDWFLRDADDRIYMFDLVSGELRQVADSRSEFEALLELEEYQREWLMSELVAQLRQSGVTRPRGQCYAFRTPPMLQGQLSPSNIVVWDLAVYQFGTSQVHQQITGLPPGTHVVIK